MGRFIRHLVDLHHPQKIAYVAKKKLGFCPHDFNILFWLLKCLVVNINPAFKIYLKFCQAYLLIHCYHRVERIMK